MWGLFAVCVLACDASRTASMQDVSEAVALAGRGDFVNAARALETAIYEDENNAYAHYYLGLIRLQEFGDAERGLESLLRASELMPGEPEVRYQVGVAQDERGERDAAGESFRAALSLDPAHAQALFRLGELTRAEGDVRGAIDLYTRAIYAEPAFPNPYNALANTYTRYGHDDEAIAVFENGIANGAIADRRYLVGHAANRADLGRVYLRADRVDDAIAVLTDAVQLSQHSPAHAFNLGVAYRARFERDGREADRELALEQLALARNRCSANLEPARCASIASALRDLRAAE